MARKKQKPVLDLSFIAKDLHPLAVDIATLNEDPNNAREHSERNLKSIRASLLQFGQRMPLIVRRATMQVEAGNGRLTAMREMGWKHVAVIVVDDDEVTARKFALADNRTGELAEWDYEILSKQLAEMCKAGDLNELEDLGWSSDELDVLCAADWTAPTIDPNAGIGGNGGTGVHSVTLEFGDDDFVEYQGLIAAVKDGTKSGSAGAAVMHLLRHFDADA